MLSVIQVDYLKSVSKPVKGKCLLLCMNSIMYLLLTSHAFIMLFKVLSHLIMKPKTQTLFQQGVLKYFKN